jgi:predicted MFS family arabinose efflux permease
VSFTGLRRRLYALSFVDEFGPVYAVSTLWFNDNGVSTAEISTAFLVWAIIALALEIPSGALADRVDRRHLLAAAFTTRAVGITIWLVWPTFTGLLLGAALWAAHDAAASGSWEAMIHDQVTAVGHASAYQRVMARIGQFSHLGVAIGTLLGAGLLRLDVGLATLGWLTVLAHAGSISGVLLLPDAGDSAREPPRTTGPADAPIGAGPVAGPILDDVATASSAAGDPGTVAEWWATLRQGVRDARHSPVLLRLVVVGAMVEGLFVLDEYLPLLARARGGDDATAPVLVLVVWIGLLVGGEVAARRADLGGRTLGIVLVAAVAVTTAAFVTTAVWSLMLIAVGYGALELTRITTDARLQERTPAATRATVTSVRGFGGASVSMAAFVVIGVMADGDDPTPGHFVVLAALGLTGALVARWLPPHSDRETRTEHARAG